MQAGRASATIPSSFRSDSATFNGATLPVSFQAAALRAGVAQATSGAWQVGWGFWKSGEQMVGPLDCMLIEAHAKSDFRQGDFWVVNPGDIRLGLSWSAGTPTGDFLLEQFIQADEIREADPNRCEFSFGWVQSADDGASRLEIRQWLLAAGLSDMQMRCQGEGIPEVWLFDWNSETGWAIVGCRMDQLIDTYKTTGAPAAKPSGKGADRKPSPKPLALPKDEKGQTAVHQAVMANDVASLKKYLQAGADPNERDFDFNTPLHLAAAANASDTALTLLEAGAEWQARNTRGEFPLHIVAQTGAVEIARILLDHGADPNACMWKGITPLHVASWNGQPDIIDLLVAGGADVTAVNEDGNTCLHFAAGNGQIKMVKTLMGYGADPDALNQRGLDYLKVVNEGYSGEWIPVI